MKYPTILMFGAPGSGKGTQGRILGSLPGLFHFSCGDVFRNLSVNDPLAKVFIEYSSKGQLVPDEATIELWRKKINSLTTDGSFDPQRDTLVLDGIPRNRWQAEVMQNTLDVKMVLHLACPDNERMIERLQRRALHENRPDDANLDVIRDRLATYEKETRPVLEFYGSDLVRDIDSTQTPIQVLRDVLATLTPIVS